jgi:hypothetical protein
MTLKYKNKELQVKESHRGHTIVFEITWPDNKTKILYKTYDKNDFPLWKFVGENESNEASEIGTLIEDSTG